MRVKKPRFPYSESLRDLLHLMLVYDEDERITAAKALEHPFFQQTQTIK
jgi:serine/threonine protein kinase